MYLPDTELRFLRLELSQPAGASLSLQSFEFSRSIEAFWYNVARGEARGWTPRWLHREQTLWTPIGTSNGMQCALMNDDGMVEVSEGSFSIEPMLWVEGRLFTWSDVLSQQELQEGWMPVPSVVWATAEWRLRIRAEASASGRLRVRYAIDNLTDRHLPVRLFVLVRPFQVTPPWQSFRGLGGVSRIHDVAFRDGAVRVNGSASLLPSIPPAGFAALCFDQGFMAAHLAAGTLPQNTAARDAFGFATAAAAIRLGACGSRAGRDRRGQPTDGGRSSMSLPQARGVGIGEAWTDGGLTGGEPAVTLTVEALTGGAVAEARTGGALSGGAPAQGLTGHAASGGATTEVPMAGRLLREEPSFDWTARLPVLQWAGNGWISEAIHATLTATAHVLVTRSGPALQPGPRRYTRSWIRDGAMMSAALLRMGRTEEVREFIRWYAPHQRADGFVPCCVDREGIDWLVEHDSHGQLIALIADYHRFTSDGPFLEESWAFIDKAVGCIERLLDSTGLLPISVSHEGYLAQPVHSYWDDFWALRGLKDASRLARMRGLETLAQRWETLRARFAAALFASIEATRSQRTLDFIPGSIEWADFDPTATANALYLFDIPEQLDRRAVERTFDIYLNEWHGKRNGTVEWASYTPYEIRIIGALVRLGRRDAALELLRFFLADRRPPAWNQWPEIAWRDGKTPAHVGDLPHTWIAAEYVLALRSLFAYERESDDSLVLAAGLAPEWIEGEGVRVSRMPTLYGELSYSLRRVDSRTLRLEIGGGISAKLVLKPPLGSPLAGATVDGRAAAGVEGDTVTVLHTPAEVIFTT